MISTSPLSPTDMGDEGRSPWEEQVEVALEQEEGQISWASAARVGGRLCNRG